MAYGWILHPNWNYPGQTGSTGGGNIEIESFCGETTRPLLDALSGWNGRWDHTVDEEHWFILDLGAQYDITMFAGASRRTVDPDDVDIYVNTHVDYQSDSAPGVSDGTWSMAVEQVTNFQDRNTFATPVVTYGDGTIRGRYVKTIVRSVEGGNLAAMIWGDNDPIQPIFDVYGQEYVASGATIDCASTIDFELSATAQLGRYVSCSASIEARIETSARFQEVLRQTIYPTHFYPVKANQALPFDANGDYFWCETFEKASGPDNSDWGQDDVSYRDFDNTDVVHIGYGSEVLKVIGEAGNDHYVESKDFTSDNLTDFYMRFYIYIPNWGALLTNQAIFRLYEVFGASPVAMQIALNSSGDGDIRSTIYGVAGEESLNWTMASGEWHYIDIRYSPADSWATIWCDGVSKHSIAIYADFTNMESFRFYSSPNGSIHTYIDDILIRKASEYDGVIGDFPLASLVTDGSDNTGFKSQTMLEDCNFSFANPTSYSWASPSGIIVWYRMKQYDANSYLTRVWGEDTSTFQRSALATTYQNIPLLLPKNPLSGSAWTWASVNEFTAGLWNMSYDDDHGNADADQPWYTGFQLTNLYAEVIYGGTGDAWCVHAPYFGGCSPSRIRCYVKANEETNLKLRYGTSESDVINNTGSAQDTLATLVTASTNFSTIMEVTGLDANTNYYFDVLVQQASGWYDSTYEFEGGSESSTWASLPKCKTHITDDTDVDFVWACGGDLHASSGAHVGLFENIANGDPIDGSPAFFYYLGDEGTGPDDPRLIADFRKRTNDRRGFTADCLAYTKNISSRMPIYRIPSDHDVGDDNCNKVGDKDYGETLEYGKNYNFLRSFKEATPLPDLAAPDNFVGTSTGGGTSTLQDNQSLERQFACTSFNGGIPVIDDSISWNGGGNTGTVLHYDAEDGILIIELDDNTSPLIADDVVTNGVWSTNASLDNIYNFPTVSKYGIYQGQIVHWSPGDSTGAWAEVYTNDGTTITFHTNLTNTKTFASPYYTYEIYRGGIWFEFVYGNCHFISFDCRSRRDPDGTPGGDT